MKKSNIPSNLVKAARTFFKEGGIDKASVLAYYSIFSSFFLFPFIIYIFSRFLGKDPQTTSIYTMYPFSEVLPRTIKPIYKNAQEISSQLENIGIISIIIFLFLGFLIIKKIVQFVNEMCHIHLNYSNMNKRFLTRRISEFSLLFFGGLLGITSLFLTGIITFVTENKIIADNFDPDFIDSLSTFLIVYLVPTLMTFLLFFLLYKWIPEKKIYLKGSIIAAVISTLLWEFVKRGYAIYLVNYSLVGKIKGTVIAIILFGFWMEISMSIMLYGAKLTYIFDQEHNEKIKSDS